jgi:hypothetical protein
MNDDKKKGPMTLDPKTDEISVFIPEPIGERQIVEKEDGMTDEDAARDQRIIDRITGHHIPTPSESDVDEISVFIPEPIGERIVIDREPGMSEEEYREDQKVVDIAMGVFDPDQEIEVPPEMELDPEVDRIEVIIAIDPETIKSIEDLIPDRADWMSDDDYRSNIRLHFELIGDAMGFPLNDEVWEHVGLSPEYDDPDYEADLSPAPKP